MTKDALITAIRTAFQHVSLDDGIGLWEEHGMDFYTYSPQMMLELKHKDERVNWENIPYKDLVACESSLSFFDAKGMRFCLPKFLLCDILSKELYTEQGIESPEVLFTLSHDTYQENRFSLFDRPQIQCIIDFLEYKLAEMVLQYRENTRQDGRLSDLVYIDDEYLELSEGINKWKQKLLSLYK